MARGGLEVGMAIDEVMVANGQGLLTRDGKVGVDLPIHPIS